MNKILVSTMLFMTFAGCKEKLVQNRGVQTPECFKVVNGTVTTEAPSVGALATDYGNGQMGACTGTFVGHNVLITATHCLNKKNVNTIAFINQSKFDLTRLSTYQQIKPIKVLHNGVAGTGDSTSADGELEDLTILIFPDNTAPAFSPIYPGLPPNGSEGALVGYGVTDVHGGKEPSGNMRFKRIGVNKSVFSDPNELPRIAKQLKKYDAEVSYYGVLSLKGNADDGGENLREFGSLGASGDSGGPLFVNGQVAGVASSALRLPLEIKEVGGDDRRDGMTIYVSLDSKASKKLIEQAKKAGAIFGAPKTTTGGNPGEATSDSTLQKPGDGC